MIGFGCGTIKINEFGRRNGPRPVIKLVGDKLMKRDTIYWRNEDTLINLQDGFKMGISSKHLIGKTKMVKLGVNSMHTIGVLPNTQIHRKTRILGEVGACIFGQKEFEQIGIVNINSQPPTAIIVPPLKPEMKLPENYWTLAFENIKKISSALKKYFKDFR